MNEDYTAPLGSITHGRLQFTRGAANATLRADSSMGDLYRARFDGPPPEVHARDGAVTIHRPAGVAARLSVGRGASKLAFDEQRFGAIGGKTRLQTSDYDGATDRYDVEVTGGASKLSVDAR